MNNCGCDTEHARSVWMKDIGEDHFKTLEEDIKTDVLVIGGGMCGILCAYMLKNAGVDHVLVEAKSICSGITRNTTAKITSQHGLIYDRLLNRFGADKAGAYIKANEEAIAKYAKLSENIDCDFEYKNSYVYSVDDKAKIEREIKALQKLGYIKEFVSSIPLPFNIAGAVKFEDQAQFDPLKFARGITEKLNIYENTTVRKLIGTKAKTDNGSIEAKNIIVATHFPFINKHGSYFIKLYQDRSYVIALENAAQVDGMYVDEDTKGLSFRNYGELLILGGEDKRTGKKSSGWDKIRKLAKKYYPESSEKYHWASQDCMTLDDVPYIGEYSGSTKGIYVATGFNKWGMTSSMISAKILTDMILKGKSEYADVFSPQRSILRPRLFSNAFEAVVSLITPNVKRCPHLGCALKWNRYEHTWDCPCHGSRFGKNGELIDNPATSDLKAKK